MRLLVVVLPHHARDEAVQVAQRLRQHVAGIDFVYQNREIESPRITLGVAAFNRGDWDFNQLIRRADESLEKGKNLGKDQVSY